MKTRVHWKAAVAFALLIISVGCKTTQISKLTADAGVHPVAAEDPDADVGVLNVELASAPLDEFPSHIHSQGQNTLATGTDSAASAATAGVAPCYRSEVDFDPFASSADQYRNAYWMAVAARLAYDSEGRISQVLGNKMGLVYMMHLEKTGWTYDSEGYFAEINIRNKKAAILSFRGTNEKIDLFTDANAMPVPFYGIDRNGEIDQTKFLGYVHGGFANALDGIWKDVYQVAKNFGRRGPLFVTGHSLGGALATLAAARLMSAPENFQVRGLFTFGSPRVGADSFVDATARMSQSGSQIFRFVNSDDAVAVVPSVPVPPRITKWKHVGKLHWLDSRGALYTDDIAANRASSTIWTKHLSSSWVNDHLMTSYLPKLEKLIYPRTAQCQD